MGIRARRRAEEYFSVEMMVDRYEQLYRDLLDRKQRKQPRKSNTNGTTVSLTAPS
jgi:cytidylate kinase